jgi:PAS domain S-box-containing protein
MTKWWFGVALAAAVLAGDGYALEPTHALSQYLQTVWRAGDAGLPVNSIAALAQSRDGYLWVATSEGLARFDGVRFVTFDKRTHPEMRDAQIGAIVEDRKGRLWIATANALLKKDGEVFTRYTAADGLPLGAIFGLAVDHDDTVWVSARDGLKRIRRDRIERVTDGPLNAPTPFTGRVYVARDGAVWVGTAAGAFVLRSGRWSSVPLPGHARVPLVRSIGEDHLGNVWFGTNDGLDRIGPSGPLHYPTTNAFPGPITYILEDSDHNLWLGTSDRGLHRLRDGRLETFGSQEGLTGVRVTAIVEGREGELWVATNLSGLNRLRDAPLVAFTRNEGMGANVVGPIAEGPPGVMWFGTAEGGVTRYDGKSFRIFTMKDGLTSNYIPSILIDHEQTLWLGAASRGLDRLRDGKGTHVRETDGLAGNFIAVAREHPAGTIWIGSEKGLTRYDRGRGTLTRFGKAEGLSDTPVRVIEVARGGGLWIGDGDGQLFRYDGARFIRIPLPAAIRGMEVTSIHEDDDGTLWVGTGGAGVVVIRHGRAVLCAARSGMYDETVLAIASDRLGNIWMTCNRGIFRVRRSEVFDYVDGRRPSFMSVAYGVKDGMRNPECIQSSRGALLASDGTLWFATTEGAVHVDPRRVMATPKVPGVAIESVRIDGVPANGGGMLRLSAGLHALEVDYGVLTLRVPHRVRFRYMLEGRDSQWVNADLRRTAQYADLRPGTYRFRVEATDENGVWTSRAPELTIVQEPRFRDTMTFALLVAAVIALSVVGAHRLRVGALHRRQAELVRVVDERTEQLRCALADLRQTNVHLETAKQIAEELSQRNALILDAAAEGIFGLDADGTVSFINSAGAEMLGWTADALMGSHLHALLHADALSDAVGDDCAVCDASGAHPRADTPVRFRTRAGDSVPVEYTSNAIRDLDGRLIGVVVTFRNISDRLAVEQMKDEFVATVSHELRTPLTAILGALGLIDKGAAGPMTAKMQRMVKIALTNSDRLLRLVNDILDSERLVSGRVVLKPSQVDALELMQHAADVLQTTADAAGVRIEVAAVDLTLHADGDRILQTLTNLIGNALKFSPRGEAVRLGAELRGTDVIFHVADRGRGIPAEKLQLVFERFRQVEAGDATQKGGSGLGLAICRSIAEAHGGRIWVESELGHGSTFFLALPRDARGGGAPVEMSAVAEEA